MKVSCWLPSCYIVSVLITLLRYREDIQILTLPSNALVLRSPCKGGKPRNWLQQ
jgi:hypothetical protein